MKSGKICRIGILFLFTMFFLSCGQKSRISIEENIYNEIKEVDYNSLDVSSITVNSGTKRIVRTIYVDSVQYRVCLENDGLKNTRPINERLGNDRLEIIETSDKGFTTYEGYSLDSKVKKILTDKNERLWVEPAVYYFIPLDYGWRAVIKDDSHVYSLEDKRSKMYISAFCKIDEKLSRAEPADDWIKRTGPGWIY